ncbi:unnamed protein product [Chrysoparadoxa australica]
MRYRSFMWYTIFQLETVVLFFIALYEIFTVIGNLTQTLAPLAPGSPVPVRQNPMIAAIMLGASLVLWFVVIFVCLYMIRKAHRFKNLPIWKEKEIWLREGEPSWVAVERNKFWTWLLNKFRAKSDKPLDPVKCGMLQGVDLWLQGNLTMSTVYLEFRAESHVFDHMVHERYHYRDIVEVRKYSSTGLLVKVINPARRETEDLEFIFDFSNKKVRARMYKSLKSFWRRVGRNLNLLEKERNRKLRKIKRSGPRARAIEEIAQQEQTDLVSAFDKARRMETKERLLSHMVTYRDWQKILTCVKIHILEPGETLIEAGENLEHIYHLAAGEMTVSEVLGENTAVSIASPPLSPEQGAGEYKGELPTSHREQQSWAKYSAARLAAQTKGRGQRGGDSTIEFEDPEADIEAGTISHEDDIERSDSGSGSSDSRSDAEETESSVESSVISSLDSIDNEQIRGPETVLLGTLHKDDIFGVVPFLLARPGQTPHSGLTFQAKTPCVVFSIDNAKMKRELLKPKKDLTAAYYKYLSVILGERTEGAEDAMFTRKVREKRLELARAEEAQLAAMRQREEEAEFGRKDKAGLDKTTIIQQLFNFSAAEEYIHECKGRYIYRSHEDGAVLKVTGILYVTSHFFAFAGRKFVDTSKMQINRDLKHVLRHDEVITIRLEGTKGILFTDQSLNRALFEPKKVEERDPLYTKLQSCWKNEDEVTTKEMRKVLRRKMTRLSLGYIHQAEHITSSAIRDLMEELSERDKKVLFAGSVPKGLNRNQVVIGEQNFNDSLFLLCTGIVRVQRVQEHASNVLDSGKAMDRVVFQEIHSGSIFGLDSFLTASPAYSSIVVDSDKAVVRQCTRSQIMARLREDRKLASTFYRVAAISIAARLAELSPLDCRTYCSGP